MIPSQNNISFALIGKNVAAVANATLIDSYETLLDGQIALVDKDNKAMNGQTITQEMSLKFVQRSGTDLIYSPTFTAKNASARLQSYATSTEQVSFVGYNGSAGSLDVIDNNYYSVWLNLQHAYNNSPYLKDFSYKSAKTSATQAQIATGLYNAALVSFGREADKYFKFDRVASGTVAAFSTATIAKFTKGVKTVSVYTKAVAADATLTASTTSVAANALVNIPSTNGRSFTFTAVTSVGHVVYVGSKSIYVASAGNSAQNCAAIVAAVNADTTGVGTLCTASGTTTVVITYNREFVGLPPVVISDAAGTPATVAVSITTGDAVNTYYVNSTATTTAATFTLDSEWQGETGYVYIGTTAATHTGVTTSTNYGLKITSLALPFRINKYKYQKTVFTTMLQGFTATIATDSTVSANNGSGVYEQVAQSEAFSDYNSGKILRGIYLTSDDLTLDTVANTKYEVIVVSAKKFTTSLTSETASPFTVSLCFAKDSAQGDNIVTSLNTYYGSGSAFA